MTSLAQVRRDGMMSLVRMEITGLGFGCQRWCPEGGSVRKGRPLLPTATPSLLIKEQHHDHLHGLTPGRKFRRTQEGLV